MSFPHELDGHRLHDWARRAVGELSARRAEINSLNVFPVPDADTGSNMTHTMEAALAEVDKLTDTADVSRVAQALATGSVRGARGNSGLVLSQVLRAIAGHTTEAAIDGHAIADALATAVQLVDRAIADPVEGTIITVLRASAVAAGTAAQAEGDLHGVVTAAVVAARTALAKTPSQLEVLREAGVVDAGGTGFVVLMEALLAEIHGETTPSPVIAESHGRPAELEVMFFFVGDLDALQAELHPLGDSLVIARADETSGSVHIHSRDAGTVIETAYAAGTVSDLHLEVLPDAPTVDAPRRIVIAVTPAGTIADLYGQSGAVVVTPGADSRDLVSEILSRVRSSSAQELILLPNGLLDHRQLVAVERATHAFEQAITIVPTRRLVSGLAALSVHNPEAPLSVAAYNMSDAAAAMRTGIVRDSDVAGTGTTGSSLEDATEAACRPLVGDGAEQVILLTEEEIDVDTLSAALDLDVMVFPAGGMGHLVEIGVE